MADNKREIMAELVALTAEKELLRRFVLSKPATPDTAQKVSARLSVRRGQKILFFEESYPGGRVRQFALSLLEIASVLPDKIASYLQADLLTPIGDAALLRLCGALCQGAGRLRRRLAIRYQKRRPRRDRLFSC